MSRVNPKMTRSEETPLIVIERRQIVGAVYPGGSANPLEVAFGIVQDTYETKRLADRHVADTLTFTYDGHTFNVAMEPNDNA